MAHGLTALEELKLVESVSKYSALKLRCSQSDLFSYLLDRVKNLQKNFRQDIGKDYKTYFRISLRLYSINFLRDKCKVTKCSSRDIYLSRMLTKWRTASIASSRIGVPAEEILAAAAAVRATSLTAIKNREYELNNLHGLTQYSESTTNEYTDFAISLGGLAVLKTMSEEQIKLAWSQYGN